MLFDLLAQATVTATATVTGTGSTAPPELSWFTDSGWWQVILAVVALIVVWFQWIRKRLEYNVLLDIPLVTIKQQQELHGRLEISFDKQPVQELDVHAILIRIANKGNVEIDSKDWRGPISFGFGKKAEVLTAEIVEPKKYSSRAKPTANKIEVEPILFNRKQRIIIKALVREPGTIEHDSEIKGAELTRYNDTATTIVNGVTSILGLALASGFAGGLIRRIWNPPMEEFVDTTTMLAVLIIGTILIVYLRFFDRLEEKES